MPRKKQPKPRSFKSQAERRRDMDDNNSSDESVSDSSFGEVVKSDANTNDKASQNSENFEKQESSDLFSCQICCASFPSLIDFVEHRKYDCTTAAGSNIWPQFISPLNSDKQIIYKCPWCHVDFFKSSDLFTHEKVHFAQTNSRTMQNIFDMDSSGEERQESLSSFKDIHHQQVNNEHVEDTTKIKNLDGLKRTPEYLKKSPNDELMKNEDLKQNHKKWKTFYPCSYCPIEFTELSTLNLHVETIHKRFESLNSSAVLFCSPKKFENESNEQESFNSKHHNTGLTPFKGFGAFFLESSLQSFMNESYKQKMSKYLSHSIEYGCSSCFRSFPKADELQRHLMDMHACHLYRCSLCKLIFNSKVDIQVHFAVKHSDECAVFKCTQCMNVSFKTELEWQLHVKIYHLGFSNPYKCLFCKDTFTNESDLLNHISKHEKQFVCPGCDETFMVEYLLEKHLESRRCSNYENICRQVPHSLNQSISRWSQLNEEEGGAIDNNSSPKPKNHLKCQPCDVKFCTTVMDSHHNEVKIFPTMENSTSPCSSEKVLQCCFYCKQTFKNRLEMSRHMRHHHSTPNTQKCNICDEVFTSSFVLAEHKLTHCKVIKSNYCTTCKTSLRGEDDFYSHCNNHSQGSTMQCIICRQTIFSGLEMELHGRHHFNKKSSPIKCDLCYSEIEATAETFHKNGVLNICCTCHQKENCEVVQYSNNQIKTKKSKDSITRTYQCLKCQESISSDHEIHSVNHVINEGGRHECFLCLSNFDSPTDLQIHLIEHSFSHKSHITCYICTQHFSKASQILHHMLSNHDLVITKRFACPGCPSSFFFCAELENHRFTCHKHCKTSNSSNDYVKIPQENSFKLKNENTNYENDSLRNNIDENQKIIPEEEINKLNNNPSFENLNSVCFTNHKELSSSS